MSTSWSYSVIHSYILSNSLNSIGFDIQGTHRSDDTWLDPTAFVDAFANELIGTVDAQKLWSHDQKKTYKKLVLAKASEQEVAAITAEVHAFYVYFARSMTNLFGQVSYKRFNEFIERL
jgi:hypothetical protein